MSQTAVQIALDNPLILQEIFKNVTTSDLLNCRLVTFTNWYGLSTEILSRRKDVRISFTHLEHQPIVSGEDKEIEEGQKKAPGFFTDSTESPWPLSSLTTFIQNFNKFPFPFLCRRFRFSEGFLEENEDFAQFISVYGEHIIEIEVDLLTRKNVTYVVETLGKMLMKMPNLESLTIGKASLGWSSPARLFPRKIRLVFQMPSLTSVRIGPDVSSDLNLLSDLRSVSPNLRVFDKFSLPYSKSEVAGWLGYKYQGIYAHFGFNLELHDIEFFEKLARSRPKFRSMSINLKPIMKLVDPVQLQSRVSATLSKMLKASCTTLENLHNMEQLELLPDFQMPVLPQVKSMEVRIFNEFFGDQENDKEKDSDPNLDQNFECFPIKNINFPVTFPSLKILRLEGPSKDAIKRVSANNLSTFDPVNLKLNWTPTTTVTSLKIRSESTNFPPTLIQQLGQTFLGVEKLELVYLQNFPKLAPEVYTSFPKLVNFSATISIDKSCTMPLVQAALGVEMRAESDPEMMELDRISGTNPSISSLPDLKTVRLEFHSNCPEGRQLLFNSDCVGQLKIDVEKLMIHPSPSVTVLPILPLDEQERKLRRREAKKEVMCQELEDLRRMRQLHQLKRW